MKNKDLIYTSLDRMCLCFGTIDENGEINEDSHFYLPFVWCGFGIKSKEDAIRFYEQTGRIPETLFIIRNTPMWFSLRLALIK